MILLIRSSHYIRKLSDFPAGPWCDIRDSLFRRFIYKHKKIFARNPRMKSMAVQADRMGPKRINGFVKKAEHYRATLSSE